LRGGGVAFKNQVIKVREKQKRRCSYPAGGIYVGLTSTHVRKKKPLYCKVFDISSDVTAGRNIILKSIGDSESLGVETSGKVLWTRK
jgi:hypothetical protein